MSEINRGNFCHLELDSKKNTMKFMQNPILDDIEKRTRLVITRGRNIERHMREDYNKMYDCWKNTWQSAFSEEMNLTSRLFSDDFSRQDQIISLFYDDECVGLAFNKYIDLSDPVALDDSYFKSWPETSVRKVSKLASKISTASYFTVGSRFRGPSQVVRWKHLVIELFVKNFLSSNADLMVAAARKNKSNESTTYNSGAFPLALGLDYHISGETIDLVCWNKKATSNANQEIAELADRIWKKYKSSNRAQKISQPARRIA